MDLNCNVQSQCVLDTSVEMDSPANFYDYDCDIDKRVSVKQEHFDIEESNIGLGDFLNSEDSVDLQAYLEKCDQANSTNTSNHTQTTLANHSDEIVRQLRNFARLQPLNLITDVSTEVCGGQPQQQTVHEAQFPTNSAHISDTVTMPITQSHVSCEHTDTSAVVPVYSHSQDFIGDQVSLSAASSPGMPTSAVTPSQSQASPAGSTSGKRKRPIPNKNSPEYKQKRERNNIAVRKSREKTKMKNKELQGKVGELQGENTSLKKRVEMLTKELTVLKSLFTNVGKTVPHRLEKAVE